MPELITERIRRNARELRLSGIAENPDELIDSAEQAKLGYREFLDLVLESEVGMLEGRRYASRSLRLTIEDGWAAAPQNPRSVPRLLPARAGPQAAGRAALARLQ